MTSALGVAPYRRSTAEFPGAPANERASVFELVGPAGAGKSSLLAALARQEATLTGVRVGVSDRVVSAIRTLPSWAAAAGTLVLAAPSRAAGELRHVVRVRTLQDAVAAGRVARRTLILDEGPVYSLTRLRSLRMRRPSPLTRHAARLLDAWGATLAGIVWVDASDDDLAHRIRNRAKAHRVKSASDADIREFLLGYRIAYQSVIADLRMRGVVVHAIDTSRTPLSDAVDQVLTVISGIRYAG